MKIPLLAISAMMVFTACNREAKRDADASEAARNDAQSPSESARQEAREAGNEASGVAERTGDKVSEEVRQTSRDVKGYLKADDAASTVDREILNRIRAALKSDAETAKEAGDISISVNQGKVALFGTVTSTDTKAEMIRITEKEKGVVRVTEEIKIAERVGAGSGD